MENRPIPEKEKELIRRSFGGDDTVLKAVRALFFNLPVTEADRAAIKSTFGGEMLAITRKRFLPSLDKETPIGQVQDVWLGAEQMVFAQSPQTIEQAIQYKAQAIEMTKVALALLENPDGPKVDIEFAASKYLNDPLGINLLARNQFIRHVEQQLLMLWLVANDKEVKASAKDGTK
jgi:hypothetical protein